ncbi:glycosyltransferase family 4 protein [Pontibacter sp. 13R65]|uniref:glycosyltransferase family 4 protein n=1 Tax=Pontibacter sp. 13R65 TaxID=3127458 RepID=UPI00301E333C
MTTLNVAYFASGISKSETFISDLINGLSKEVKLTIITSDQGESFNNVIIERRQFPYKYSKLTSRIFSILGHKSRMKFDKYYVQNTLKDFFSKNTFDIAYIDYGTTAVLLRELLEVHRIPYIVHFHGFDITSALNNLYYRNEIKSLFASVGAIVAASNHIKKLIILQGADEAKVHVIKYGIDAANFQPVSWEEKFYTTPSVVFLGRLTPKKNPIALLHAFKIVTQTIPTATLTIIGDGPLYKDVVYTIAKLDLKENVKLHGKLGQLDALAILKQHWVYAQHSVTSYQGDQEGFAISLAEASSLKLPVVSTIHNGIPENVLEGVTGFLVKEYDYEAMAEKILILLQNKDLIREMGEAGRLRVLNNFRPETRISKMLELFKSVKYSAAFNINA